MGGLSEEDSIQGPTLGGYRGVWHRGIGGVDPYGAVIIRVGPFQRQPGASPLS